MDLKRRTFLRSSGIALALPLLESMRASAAVDTAAPKRSVFICTTLGLLPSAFWPNSPGTDYEATEYLKLLEDHRQDFTLFSGLSHQSQTGRQPHNSEMTFLTSAERPGLDGFRNTISIDQLAADGLGRITRFPSVTLGSNSSQSQSYTGSGVMIPAETSPAGLFGKLFLEGKPHEVKQQELRLADGKSILDQLRSQTKSLKQKTSTQDNRHLDEYFESIRQAETDITEAQRWMAKPKPTVDAEKPRDVLDKSDLIGRTKLLLNLIPLILQTDSSRVIAVMIQDHYVVPKIQGVTAEHHNLSHHGQDPAKIAQLKIIEAGLLGCFSDLLTQMKTKQELGGSLLDSTGILFGSNLGNANAHVASNLPIILAGGGHDHGRYVAFDSNNNVPLCNLFVRMLQDMNLDVESFGQSNGTLRW